jgi:CPA2 family monovalent cation:H+ antiporter-2
MDGPVQELTRHAVQHGLWLKDLFVFLAATALVVPLFHRARIGAVAGFLLIGVAVGPYGLGRLSPDYEVIRLLTIEDKARVQPFAELGVMFLLFLIGLELSFSRLWSLRRFVLGLGSAQFLGSAAAIAVAALLLGAPVPGAAVLGVSLAMSSTAVVMELLEESGRSGSPLGRVSLSVLLFQDLMVAPILFGVELLGGGGANVARDLGLALLQAAGVVAVLVLAGRYALRPLFRFAARTASRELIMAMTILIVVVMAAATGAFGMSTALGAFLAGILLGETEYRHQIDLDIAPFKGLLLGLFFVTVGMSIDLGSLAKHWLGIGAAVATLIALKAVVLFCASRIIGIPKSVSAEVALLLAQAGEFGFVVLTLGTGHGLIAPDLAQFAIAVTGLTMLLTPLGAIVASRVGARLYDIEHAAQLPQVQRELSGHVIIGGYGRVGQAIAAMLDAEHIGYVALDTNGELVTTWRGKGKSVFFGDSGRGELLRLAGSKDAAVVVVTVNAPRAAERMVAAARRENPNVPIVARARDMAHAERLKRLGAIAVVPETLETSLLLGERLLDALGLPDDAIERRIGAFREKAIAPSPV